MNPSALVTSLLVLTLALAPGCSHVAVVSTDPPGADVALDGVSLGQTDPEVEVASTYGLPGDYQLEVARQGYKPKTLALRRTYHADVSLLWLLAGFVPYIFTARLDDRYDIELMADIPEDVRPSSSADGPARALAHR